MPDVQKFLDNLTGLPTLWSLIKSNFVAQESGKGLSSNDFTNTLKSKLDGISSGAEVNQNAFSNVSDGTTTVSASSKTDTVTLEAGSNVTITANTANKKLTIDATDTTYSDVVAGGTSGLMSGSDKTKLNGIATGAQVNQNAFSNVKSGASTIASTSTTDTIEFIAGSNITLVPDTANKTLTINSSGQPYSKADADNDGLMSKEDFVKLSGIASGAQVNVLEAVQVNGTALSITSKAVNLTVAEGTANGTIKFNGTDYSVHGLDTAAYAKTSSSVGNNTNLPTGAAVQSYVTGLGYQTAGDVSTAISTAISSAYIYKGSVATEAALPQSGQKTGDIYNIEAASSYGPAGMNVAWNGTAWDALGSSITIEAMTAAEIQAICV